MRKHTYSNPVDTATDVQLATDTTCVNGGFATFGKPATTRTTRPSTAQENRSFTFTRTILLKENQNSDFHKKTRRVVEYIEGSFRRCDVQNDWATVALLVGSSSRGVRDSR